MEVARIQTAAFCLKGLQSSYALPKDKPGAARAQRSRRRRGQGLQVLLGSLAVDPETIAILTQKELLPACETDEELLRSIRHLLNRIAQNVTA